MDQYYDKMALDNSIDETGYEVEIPFNIHNISHVDMLNGEGLRVVLWLAGCSHRCPGCQNPETWGAHSGIPFTQWEKYELFDALGKDYIQGITFSGGDPLYKGNRNGVGELLSEIKEVYPMKDVWLYTGYTLDIGKAGFYFKETSPWIKVREEFTVTWLDLVDVIVDGPFMADVRKGDLAKRNDPHWCGSSNQRVIDMKKSVENSSIVLYRDL